MKIMVKDQNKKTKRKYDKNGTLNLGMLEI